MDAFNFILHGLCFLDIRPDVLVLREVIRLYEICPLRHGHGHDFLLDLVKLSSQLLILNFESSVLLTTLSNDVSLSWMLWILDFENFFHYLGLHLIHPLFHFGIHCESTIFHSLSHPQCVRSLLLKGPLVPFVFQYEASFVQGREELIIHLLLPFGENFVFSPELYLRLGYNWLTFRNQQCLWSNLRCLRCDLRFIRCRLDWRALWCTSFDFKCSMTICCALILGAITRIWIYHLNL